MIKDALSQRLPVTVFELLLVYESFHFLGIGAEKNVFLQRFIPRNQTKYQASVITYNGPPGLGNRDIIKASVDRYSIVVQK